MAFKNVRNSWDSIPTQSQSKHKSCHQPFAFDANQKFNGKAGRPGGYRDVTQERVKTRKGNTVMGGLRINNFEAYPGLSPVYESPQDMVFRDGKYITIAEYNAAQWKAKKSERKAKRNKGGK